MSMFSSMLAFVFAVMFFSAILFVVFGQITVRKLRKKPETKEELGIEFASGWDILNVAGALSMPKWLNRKLRNSPLSALYANADLLYNHTSRFDRFLAKLFYWPFMLSGFGGIVLVILNSTGLFE